MNKLKSFTLLEIIIVMLLSTAVISIALGILNIFVKQITDFKNNNAEITELNTLNHLLLKDFFQCQKIIKREDGIECFYKNRNIIYHINSTYVLRQDSIVMDTFHTNATKIFISYKEAEITEENKWVDALIFCNECRGETQYFRYRKVYPADVLLEINFRTN